MSRLAAISTIDIFGIAIAATAGRKSKKNSP